MIQLQTNRVMRDHLDPVANRLQFRRVCLTLTALWALSALAGWLLIALHRGAGVYQSWWAPALALAVAAVSLVGLLMAFLGRRNYRRVAQAIERKYPDLDAAAITAVEQIPREGARRFDFLQQQLLRKAVYHDFQHPWTTLVPVWQMVATALSALIALAAVAASLVLLFLASDTTTAAPEGSTEFADVAVEAAGFDCEVDPGDTEVEKGQSLLVLARFRGPVPADATLSFAPEESGDGADHRNLAMNKSLSDPVFASRIPDIDRPLQYEVHYENERLGPFRVDVFEFPRLIRMDAHLDYPDYTGLEDGIVQDVRQLSAVEGTNIRLVFELNKPVERGWLESSSGETLVLESEVGYPQRFTVEWTLATSQRFDLHLVDAQQRRNRVPPRLGITVLPNQLPRLDVMRPARDVEVSPLEELSLAVKSWDDFGISRIGFSYSIPGGASSESVLQSRLPGRQSTESSHLLEMETIGVQPDQLIAYHFWAEDVGPDGEPRRVESDMFFAEVRPFEEIYRQGQQPTQNQMQQQQAQQNAQAAGELAELQKQIINATWKIIRREKGLDDISSTYTEDVATVEQSQSDAIQQLQQAMQQIQDPQSSAQAAEVNTQMESAVVHLQGAASSSDPRRLDDALVAEQRAYQCLLKLRAREHEIVRNQQMQNPSGQRQNQRSQKQMQQLQLDDDVNRYEEQRQAEQETSPEAREDRQVLNRLRELARRQNDLNERIKELQSALEKAADENERKEIERRLKRLQEEQQQILRDTEELQERMQQPENQQRMDEQARQLEQARENIRQSSEALREGQVSRAAAQGERAESELNQLRDEFQNRTSSQFSEAMQNMRDQAREIESRQDELAQQLDELDRQENTARSLRDSNRQQDVTQKLDQQGEQLRQLRDRMRDTIKESEAVEPLLAQELYDTYRNAEQNPPESSLESAARSLARGLIDDARDEEREAAEGIRELREGIDRAAESVLGDEEQALRRANAQLDRIKKDLEEEIAREDPDTAPNDAADAENERGDGSGGEATDEPPADPSADRRPGDDNTRGATGEAQNDASGDPLSDNPGQQPPARDRSESEDPREDESGENAGGDPFGPAPGGDSSAPPRRPTPLNLRDDPDPDPAQRGGASWDPRLRRGDDRDLVAPLTGEDFRDWSDRLRDLEEMVPGPELRSDAARIRDEANEIRKELKRHSREPNWDLVRLKVLTPLTELQDKVREQLLRKTGQRAQVPLDRDPVPTRFEESVQRYYRELGIGK